MSQELAHRPTVTALVASFEASRAEALRAYAMLAKAEQDIQAAFMCTTIRIASDHRSTDWANPSAMIAELERETWYALLQRLDIFRMLSTSRREKLEARLRHNVFHRRDHEDGPMPSITVANVMTFLEDLLSKLPNMLQEAVDEVFDFLRPWNSALKTNSKFEIGNKVILEHAIESCHYLQKWTVRERASAQLTALSNVFTAMDGKGQITKTYYSELETAIRQAPYTSGAGGQTEYFKFRIYKNGSLHIEFLRPDLVKKLNMMSGGKRLRSAA